MDSQPGTAQISGIINSYARVSAIGTNVLTVDNVSLAPDANLTDAFGPGSKVMIIQMKGALVQTGNAPDFGSILDYRDAGNYELAEVLALSGSGPSYTLTLSPLTRNYDVHGTVQLVSVPQYLSIRVVGELTAATWSASTRTGGILALEVLDTLKLAANIQVNHLGFQGGLPNVNNQNLL
ncbi:MAG: hypothetical protein HC880_04045 [Bacteroidia bacterium]|nr:hypothetical protein [Bacteroidia bacterium]